MTCLSSCCLPRVSQINGANGEATGTDDLKNQDRKQNARLSKIENKIRSLTLSRKTKSAPKNNKRRQVAPKVRSNNGQTVFPGIPAPSSMDNQPPIIHRDPTVISAVAQMAPFRIPRGVASLLSNSTPSQKFTARALLTLSVPSGQESIVHISPCVAADSNACSMITFTGARATLNGATLATQNPAGITFTFTSTNTPYSASVLAGKDFKWRLVSSGIRIRNTTAAVNRQGILRFIVNHEDHISLTGTATHGGIISSLESNHRTVRRNMSSHPETDIVIGAGLFYNGEGWYDTLSTALLDENSYWPVHGTSNPRLYGAGVSAIASGTAFVALPDVGSAQSYDFEMIEHWEVTGLSIETLHTPSCSHPMMYETVNTIMKQSHHQHGLTPSMALHDVAKSVSFAEHHKAALKEAGGVAMALAML